MILPRNVTALTNEDNGILSFPGNPADMEYKGYPDADEYGSMLMTWNSAMCIAQKLYSTGVCMFGASVGASTAFNFCVADVSKARQLQWNTPGTMGMPWLNGCGDIYISIERIGGFAFQIDDRHSLRRAPAPFVHPGYFEEKMGHRLGDVVALNLTEFFGMVIHCWENLKT